MARPDPILTPTRLRAGVWEGELRSRDGGSTLPAIAVTLRDQPLDTLRITSVDGAAGRWLIRVLIPSEHLSDGVQTFLIRNLDSGATLGSFSIVAGAPLDEDLRAEIELLRAELDMLKQAFRRHCRETAPTAASEAPTAPGAQAVGDTR
jgi:hypothetical protein